MQTKFTGIDTTKADTCLTFAIRRVGLSQLLPLKYENLEKFFEFIPFDKTEIQECDILLWNEKLTSKIIPNRILEDGRILSTSLFTSIHFGVVERDSFISDLSGEKEIRLRELAATPWTWNFILRLKPEINV